jgi:DEAD/DEAH box helicase domain-containing protein
MNDTIVFDIETQNFFTNPGVGWNNFGALKISVVAVYSYEKNEYFCYEEDEMEQLGELFRSASRIVGFCSNRYDTPVLNLYFKKLHNKSDLDLWKKHRIDLLEEVETLTGKRISLSKLAKTNLGVEKSRHGSEAIGLYERGQIQELKEYCINDVRLTKELYDLYLSQGYFLVPDRDSGDIEKVIFPKQTNALFPSLL